MKRARHRTVPLALVLALGAGGFLIGPAATTRAEAQVAADSEPTGSGSTETTTTLSYEAPHASASHEAGAGEWSFVVEANRAVTSVRISIAEGTCETGGTTLWDTKVTDDELRSGAVARQVAFEEGSFCSHLLLDGTNKASAAVTTTVPARLEPEPDPDPTYVSSEYERCSDDPDVEHRVLAGATGPEPDAPFIYQKFYPTTLQVHTGDIVEWCFNGAYDWHTVTFLPVDMDVATHPEPSIERAGVWRWDETGQKAFNEPWIFGPELGDETKQCGRGQFFTAAPQGVCTLSSTDQWVSSAIWDRFFSTPSTGTFATKIDLPPGLYRYHCNIHSSMQGFIEVLPAQAPVINPTQEEIDLEIAADHSEAQKIFRELSDPSDAYDFSTGRWTVRVGAETPTRSVSIEQFIPSRIDVRKGDTVHFVAGTDEPNTVTFPGGQQVDGAPESDLQGGFSLQGECGPHSCPTGRRAPWGMTGLAFIWNCDADDRSSGLVGSLPYVPPATSQRTNGAINGFGCVAGGMPEMITQPWYGEGQAAPGNLVVSEKTFHNSGAVLDEALPDWYRRYPAMGPMPGGTFPHTFDAKFPTVGKFKYFCAAHEFMKGMVVVK
jgi:plastocyanin